eukprot:Platyproteum_vivax@DN6887_c0_g2_i2.p2
MYVIDVQNLNSFFFFFFCCGACVDGADSTTDEVTDSDPAPISALRFLSSFTSTRPAAALAAVAKLWWCCNCFLMKSEVSSCSSGFNDMRGPPTGVFMPPIGVMVPPTGVDMPPMGVTAPPMGVTAPPMGVIVPPRGVIVPPSGVMVPPRGVTVPPTASCFCPGILYTV